MTMDHDDAAMRDDLELARCLSSITDIHMATLFDTPLEHNSFTATLRPHRADIDDARPVDEQPAGPGGIHYGRTNRTEVGAAIACAAGNGDPGSPATGAGRAAGGRARPGDRAITASWRRTLRICRDTSWTSERS